MSNRTPIVSQFPLCPNCNNELPPNKKRYFCEFCGFELRSDRPTRDNPAPPTSRVGKYLQRGKDVEAFFFPVCYLQPRSQLEKNSPPPGFAKGAKWLNCFGNLSEAGRAAYREFLAIFLAINPQYFDYSHIARFLRKQEKFKCSADAATELSLRYLDVEEVFKKWLQHQVLVEDRQQIWRQADPEKRLRCFSRMMMIAAYALAGLFLWGVVCFILYFN